VLPLRQYKPNASLKGDIQPFIVLGVYCDRPKNSTLQKRHICEVNGSIVWTYGAICQTYDGPVTYYLRYTAKRQFTYYLRAV